MSKKSTQHVQLLNPPIQITNARELIETLETQTNVKRTKKVKNKAIVNVD